MGVYSIEAAVVFNRSHTVYNDIALLLISNGDIEHCLLIRKEDAEHCLVVITVFLNKTMLNSIFKFK